MIELLISTALVATAYVVVLGPGSALGQKSRKAKCVQQLEQMHQALSLYAAEHDGAFPSVPGATTAEAPLSLLVPLYTSDTSVFICPGTGRGALPAGQPFADRKISYAYSSGLRREAAPGAILVADALTDTLGKREGEALFSTQGSGPGSNHRRYGGNVLFVDGHVETFPATAPRELRPPAGAALLNPKP